VEVACLACHFEIRRNFGAAASAFPVFVVLGPTNFGKSFAMQPGRLIASMSGQMLESSAWLIPGNTAKESPLPSADSLQGCI